MISMGLQNGGTEISDIHYQKMEKSILTFLEAQNSLEPKKV